jgi:hypothetical protein
MTTMRIQYLSDYARQQLGVAQQQLDAAAAGQVDGRRAYELAVADARTARQAKPRWKRLLRRSTGDEKAARTRAEHAERAIEEAAADVDRRRQDVQRHAAGVQGEDILTWHLADLTDEWVMLRGYRNRRGETDHLLVGPTGVWAIEVKRRAVRVHIVGDQWSYEKLDRWGNVVETGWATDRSGRSWACQVTDVADDLGAWLRKNGHDVPIRTAVMLMHERALIGTHDQLTVDLVANHPDHLRAAMRTNSTLLTRDERDEIIRLITRDHRFHHERRQRH